MRPWAGTQALFFGEELKDPHRRMGRVVVTACLVGALATALPIMLVVLSAPDLARCCAAPPRSPSSFQRPSARGQDRP